MGTGLLLRHCVGLGITIRWRPRDALLLAAPRIIIGGVTDVVVDEGVGLLAVRVQLVFAVAGLEENRKETCCYTVSLGFYRALTLSCQTIC